MLGGAGTSGGLSKAPCPHTNVRQIDSRRQKKKMQTVFVKKNGFPFPKLKNEFVHIAQGLLDSRVPNSPRLS